MNGREPSQTNERGPDDERGASSGRIVLAADLQPAFTTFPAERQDVQIRIFLRVPFSVTIRADCRFGSQRRFVLLFAWLTLFPARGPFPQTAQTAAMGQIHVGVSLSSNLKNKLM